MDQRIAFARSKDKTTIAYALSGEGPPLVRAGTWLTHVHHDWESPIWAHWLRFMSERHTLVRYDPRGCGLSQTDVGTITFDDWVADLEAVVDRLELESFPLFGMSQGAAVAAEYAIRHPERVTQLTLYAPLVTGWRGRTNPYCAAVAVDGAAGPRGWGEDNMAFPSMFAHLFLPRVAAADAALVRGAATQEREQGGRQPPHERVRRPERVQAPETDPRPDARHPDRARAGHRSARAFQASPARFRAASS